MIHSILTTDIRYEPDVVLARQRAREIAAALGFEGQDQTRIATAVSELARNAYRYAGGGKLEFSAEVKEPQALIIKVSDQGPGIPHLKKVLDGRYQSSTGMGIGIIGAKRLMDGFEISTEEGKGTEVVLRKLLDPDRVLSSKDFNNIAGQLIQRSPQNAFQELQQQNQELMRTLAELQQRQAELALLNAELEDTNRGVVALYAELDDKAGFLQRANELKTRFFSNMSHEFRTPLHTIVSIARILLDRMDGDLTPEQEKQVNFILKASQDLSEMVNDLLDLAKVEAGKVPVRPAHFEIANIFGALRGMLRPLIGSNQSVQLVFEDPVGIPTMYGDETKISQILRNFITNAIKFTPKGEVRVSATMGDGNMVRFAVADTGIGIAPEDQERIFEEWAQVDNPLQRHYKGTGLGLPLSRKLAELMGGRVYLESTPGIGSTFYAAVPLRFESGAGNAPVEQSETAHGLPVLVIEDSPANHLTYQKDMQGTEFFLMQALNVRQATEALRKTRPVAIVLDLMLENEATWLLVHDLKRDERTRNIPVLVVSNEDYQAKAAAVGADDFLRKPASRAALLNSLRQMIRKSGTAKVLLVDDEEASRYVLRGWLPTANLTVLEASGGQEGLLLARRELPQVIFLDLMMPDMTGFDVLEALKADAETAQIPVIINTGKKLTDADQARLHAATAVISKETASTHEARAVVRHALVRAGLELPEESEARHA